jgi:hypothetical protein
MGRQVPDAHLQELLKARERDLISGRQNRERHRHPQSRLCVNHRIELR